MSERPASPTTEQKAAVGYTAPEAKGPAHLAAGPALDPVSAGDEPVSVLAPAALAALLGPLATAPGLGRHVGIAVADASSPALLYDGRSSDQFAPASTNKVVTAVAALAALGPDRRLATRVLTVPNAPGGSTFVLVGGGDPTLASAPQTGDAGYQPASLDDLAARTAAALTAQGVKSITLDYDATLFGGPALHPTWSAGYTDGNVAPVTGLMADEGRSRPGDDLSPRVPDPALQAATTFAARLAAHGVQVAAKPAAVSGYATTPTASVTTSGPVGPDDAASGAGASGVPAEIARVESPRLADLVEHMLTVSDNDVAEALIRHVAIADDKPATFEGGVTAVRDYLGAHLGVDVTGLATVDGSGLSRADRLTPALLVRVLTLAASDGHPELRAAITGLPVAAFTGTLAENNRFAASSAAGLVRAKTGSLTGVDTLAGIVRAADGQLLVFALMADQAPDAAAARAAIDKLATALSGCGCGAAAGG